MKSGHRSWAVVPSGLVLALAVGLLGACGGTQRVEVVVEAEPEEEMIEEIVGVVPAAMGAFNRGVRALRRAPSDYDAAVREFQSAIALDPNFWEAYENLGLVFLDLGRFDEAVATFEQQSVVMAELRERQWPVERRPEIFLNLGKAHALAGRVDAAAEAFRAILRIAEEEGEDAVSASAMAEARANMAALFAMTGDHAGAERMIAELLVATQDDVGALNVLASLYKERGDLQMARYLWEKTDDLIVFRVERLQQDDQYEGMNEETAARVRDLNEQRVARLEMVRSDLLNELGLVAFQEGAHQRAARLFQRSLDLNPRNFAARMNLAAVLLEYAAFEGACEEFAEVLALRPREERALLGFATCAYGMGDIDDAYARFERLVSLYPNNTFGIARLGDIAFQERNDLDTAERWYTRHLELRGLSRQSCEPRGDRICAAVQGIQQMRQMQQQMGTPPPEG